MKTYLFEYSFEGATYILEMRADDKDEAQRRVGQLVFARYVGELQAKIPAPLGWLAKLLVWLKNCC